MAKRYSQLTLEERYHIGILIQHEYSNKKIAVQLGRDKSTIGREIKRNCYERKRYTADKANELAKNRCERDLPSKFTELAKDKIRDKLVVKWSPKKISAWLKSEYNIFISYELIYQYINDDRKSGGTLYKLLPCRGKKYKRRNIKTRKVWKKVPTRMPISKRPAKKKLKQEIGHWEGDTVESKGHRGGLGTFVDMKSKYVVIRKLRNKSSEEMKNAIIGSFKNCPELIQTLTVDNGSEFALHDNVRRELKSKVYFADPYSPWQRGLNENTNGLIRKFYPKGTDFSKIPEREILKVQELLNSRPRDTLDFKTPKEIFMEEVFKNKKYKNMLMV
jgi:transposase, IS30 family